MTAVGNVGLLALVLSGRVESSKNFKICYTEDGTKRCRNVWEFIRL